jgi:hypothetical protein
VCDFNGSLLEHDPEKWKPVFRKDHARTKRWRRDVIRRQMRKGGHKGTNWAEIRGRKRHERGRIALAADLPLALSGWVV